MSTPATPHDLLEVVCIVLVDQKNRILSTQRPAKGTLARKWEFPGGKVEDGENRETALRREIREELCTEVGSLTVLSPVTHTYEFGTIRLWPFLSHCDQRPALTLVEHTNFLWSDLSELESLDWAPADVPVLDQLKKLL